jgi:hypothetical protein
VAHAKRPISEHFLQYLWRIQNIDTDQLKLYCGNALRIHNWGHYNTNAGPDFLDAEIVVGDTIWCGHIELHVMSSEWYEHGHAKDPAYANVILHVVYQQDKIIYRPDGTIIPCLELKHRIDFSCHDRYLNLMQRLDDIPCQELIAKVDEVVWTSWLDALLVERLQVKTTRLIDRLNTLQLDWEGLYFELIAQYLGGVNASSMQSLAQRMPPRVLMKERYDPRGIPALLFGQAGLLTYEVPGVYYQELKSYFSFLKNKYHLKPMRTVEWKFGRMRPANFPSLRIAQLSTLIQEHGLLFKKTLDCKTTTDIYNLFTRTSPPEFWNTHYHFLKKASNRQRRIGQTTAKLLVINAVAPILYLYGTFTADPKYVDRSIELLVESTPEENKITRKWQLVGRKANNALESQAYIQLMKNYCIPKKCLNCRIGHSLLRNG